MSDTTVWQHNANGPLAWVNKRWWDSYGGGGPMALFRMSGLDLEVGVVGEAGTSYVVVPGDDSGEYPQIVVEENGTGSGAHLYAAPGTYTAQVVTNTDPQTLVAEQVVTATAPEVPAS